MFQEIILFLLANAPNKVNFPKGFGTPGKKLIIGCFA
jgi:hypothetical protein